MSRSTMEKTTASSRDTQRLRELGKRVRDIAAHPDQEMHRKIWTAVNDGAMIRPAILARDTAVHLLNYNDELTTIIEDEFLQKIEAQLLMKLYEWTHLQCHTVVEPWVLCPAAIEDTGYGIDISNPGSTSLQEQTNGELDHARHFDRIIDNDDDLDMIQFPRVAHNEDETFRRKALLEEIFDSVLEVKLFGKNYFRFVPWDDLLSWMGLEQGMYDFILNPEFMHRAITRYTDASLHQMRQYEALGLASSNNTNNFTGTGGYGYTSLLPKPTESGMGARLCDMWGSIANQIFTSVSPEMTLEFAVEHEKRWAENFGYMYYGCCERLDHKLAELRQLPNLRKVSMSPYAVIEEGMEKMGKDLIVSFKPNSNYLAIDNPDYDLLKDELIKVCSLARKYNCNVEILMKTIITLQGDPQRLWKWCDMAREIVADY